MPRTHETSALRRDVPLDCNRGVEHMVALFITAVVPCCLATRAISSCWGYLWDGMSGLGELWETVLAYWMTLR